MSYIKITVARMEKAVQEQNSVLFSYFNPKDRTPIERTVKGTNVGQVAHIVLDYKRFDLERKAPNIYYIK